MTNATSLRLKPHQHRYATHIVHAVRDRELSKRAAVIAVEVALAESGLTMYANANNADSLDLPHDAVGFDHGSVGLFQQQVGGAPNSTADWGTTKDLMDPEISCDKFLQALLKTQWKTCSNWSGGQHVQNSAYDGNPRAANNWSSEYGGNYKAHDEYAAQIVNAIWNASGGLGPTLSAKAAAPSHRKYWVDTFDRAPVFTIPGGAVPSGTLYRGRNYVLGKRWAADVRTDRGHNHWWLRTEPDEGGGSWVSAYYLTHWGDDEAKDNAGQVIPNC